MDFGSVIINWYHSNKRDLPWRNTRNPYHIWLSEVILQQTRVEQGLSYYYRFTKAFPTIKNLAQAKEEKVLKLWQGLGYYSRARNLHYAARHIVKEFNGRFPKSYEDIRSLKGVGDYTAAAIASFAFNLPYPVVDGNVYRLLSRYLGIKTPINTTVAKLEFTKAARLLMGKHNPHDFNQAIMEFGALQCKPQQPLCTQCPLSKSCYAYAKNRVKLFPVKKKVAKPVNRFFYYLHIKHGKYTYLKKRKGNDIWKNLYEFPMYESVRKLHSIKLNEAFPFIKLNESTVLTKEFKHQLSHQTIHSSFISLTLPTTMVLSTMGLKKLKHADLESVPTHRLMEKYLESE